MRRKVTDRATTLKIASEMCGYVLDLIENTVKCTIKLFIKNKIGFCDPT